MKRVIIVIVIALIIIAVICGYLVIDDYVSVNAKHLENLPLHEAPPYLIF